MTELLAMHMSDGIVNAPVSLIFGAIAVVGLACCLARARADLDDRTAPMAGLVAAFVFAVQMLNFPVLPGVSGHLLGGGLVAVLVGPYVGALCMAIVLLLQSLLFADGGLSALGTNVTNMALVGTFAGFAVAVLMRRIARRSRRGLLLTAFLAGWTSTVLAAMGFVAEYALGGQGLAFGTVLGLMFGLHALIGIGEGIITALTVGAVAAARPDLVHLLRGQGPELAVRTAAGSARPTEAGP